MDSGPGVSMDDSLSLGECPELGAGWCNAPSPVLRGAGRRAVHGQDIVAPPGNQAANREDERWPKHGETPAYSPTSPYRPGSARSTRNPWFPSSCFPCH